MNGRRYQIIEFVPESAKDKYIFGVIRWHMDNIKPCWLGEWETREAAARAVRNLINSDGLE